MKTTHGGKRITSGRKPITDKNIKGYNIEGYTVISINGVLTIGCHRINMSSVHNVGKQII